MTKKAKKPELERLLELHRILLQFQAIERHICYLDKGLIKSENDAEHSYSLTMTAWFLAQYFPHLDRDKVIRIALAHDLIEIHSGDTSVFDAVKVATKDGREADAVVTLEKEWSDFPEMIEAVKEYKNKSSEEAKFTYALDKIMPIMLNIVNEGLGWQKHGITFAQLHATKKDKVTYHKEIAEYYEQILELLTQNPHYFSGKA